jgi:hypothetical protein
MFHFKSLKEICTSNQKGLQRKTKESFLSTCDCPHCIGCFRKQHSLHWWGFAFCFLFFVFCSLCSSPCVGCGFTYEILSNVSSVFIRRGKLNTHITLCKVEGRNKSYASARQVMLKIATNHWKLGGGPGAQPPSEPWEGSSSSKLVTLMLNFEPPEHWGNKFLMF